MSLTNNPGRVAGLLYLLLCAAGPVRLIYIPENRVSNITFPILTGAVVFMLWLVIMGAKPKAVVATSSQ
jgi:hypothetical protein